jgi:hypothetical protein
MVHHVKMVVAISLMEILVFANVNSNMKETVVNIVEFIFFKLLDYKKNNFNHTLCYYSNLQSGLVLSY